MRQEIQVTGPGTSMVLQSLGIRLKSDYMWKPVQKNIFSKEFVLIKKELSTPLMKGLIHAYTIAELGIMIPWGLFQMSPVHKLPGGIWQITLKSGKIHSYATEVEARAHYLIDLINNKDVTIDEINHPEQQNQPVKSSKL